MKLHSFEDSVQLRRPLRIPHSPPPFRTQMLTIGIIGGVASGKSAVARRLGELGAVVLDADAAGHEVLRDEAVKAAIRQRFGDKVFTDDGEVNRRAVAAIVFADTPAGAAALADLEAIVHPPIGLLLQEKIQAIEQEGTARVVVLDAAILLKAGWDRICDKILFIDVPREIRIQRAAQRGWTPDELDARDARQTPIEQKRAAAHVVIDNSGELANTLAQVDEFWQSLS